MKMTMRSSPLCLLLYLAVLAVCGEAFFDGDKGRVWPKAEAFERGLWHAALRQAVCTKVDCTTVTVARCRQEKTVQERRHGRRVNYPAVRFLPCT